MQANQKLLTQIKAHVCYTDLVYQRVNKKLKTDLSREGIEALVNEILMDDTSTVEKRGKNYYVTSYSQRVCLTINSYNFRLITANRVIE